MHERLAAIAASQSGVFSMSDALRVGVSTNELTRMVRRKEVIRVRRGAYVVAATYWGTPSFDRYRLRVRAVLRSRRPGERASHQSALALHKVGTFGAREDVVVLESRDVSRTRTNSGLVTVPWSGGATWEFGAFHCVSATAACVQVSVASGFIAGVSAMDSAIVQERCTHEDLAGVIATLPARPRAAAQRALDAVDPRAESVGETRTRIILIDAGFSLRSQVRIKDARTLIGRVDFLVDDCVVVEFDGLLKYGGDRGQAALVAEKAREERLTRLGYEVVRVVWAELDDPADIVRRVRRARAVARERRAALTR
ncbi:hypothetical protein GA707_04930 [Nostocoides sp. F2B08]|uniref:type IV toxin-antitoxin system AbiEi family antitoxin domain-containing protein n=1 Tax=Nostocoides sp. F2B08 TaxID=2653936 RepID=UPI001263009B|nr:type IV toxin-antitoxin system AbiEi family antitoxin domain-containing protein [Tetrasphaera sp. F2B08]KAB7745286.1 hypothetical protein GA707_04930 [Tetrasphaera sp. F2B08]